MDKIITTGRIENGTLKIAYRKEFLDNIKNVPDCRIVLTLEKQKKTRSLEQNAYYWGVVLELVWRALLDAGYRITKMQAHNYLKEMFLQEEILNEITGELIIVKGSTKNLTTTQMMEFFKAIQEWASEILSLYIPDPNEQIVMDLTL